MTVAIPVVESKTLSWMDWLRFSAAVGFKEWVEEEGVGKGGWVGLALL
jgi:hypothetical protein